MMRAIPLLLLCLLLIGCDKTSDRGNEESQQSKAGNSSARPFEHLDTVHIASDPFAEFDKVNGGEKKKDSLIDQVEGHYSFYSQMYGADDRPPLSEKFTMVHLNDDPFPDMVYEGPSGGEPEIVNLHFGSDTGLSSPITLQQHIKSISGSTSSGIRWMTLYDPGCCADPVRQEVTVSLNEKFEKDTLYHRGWLHPVQFPDTIFNDPLEIRTKADSQVLRFSPEVNDTIIGLPSEKGNDIAVFDDGATGKVWGRSESEGNEWVFVEMDPIEDTLRMDLFGHQDEGQLRRMGWMKEEGIIKQE